MNDWGREGSKPAVALELQDVGFQNCPAEFVRNTWRERQSSERFERVQTAVGAEQQPSLELVHQEVACPDEARNQVA